jgi:hypothetical protein
MRVASTLDLNFEDKSLSSICSKSKCGCLKPNRLRVGTVQYGWNKLIGDRQVVKWAFLDIGRLKGIGKSVDISISTWYNRYITKDGLSSTGEETFYELSINKQICSKLVFRPQWPMVENPSQIHPDIPTKIQQVYHAHLMLIGLSENNGG